MYKININWDKTTLKYKTLTRNFPCDTWKPNPNISKGNLIPVLINQDKEKNLQLMKWGFDKYENNNIIAFARIENLETKWKDLDFFPCIIPIKGFYFRHKDLKETNYYYFDDKERNGLFVVGLYFKQKRNNGVKYNALILTRSTENNETLWIFQDRMPIFISKERIHTWLKFDSSHTDHVNFLQQSSISLNKPIHINGSIQNETIRDESVILQSNEEWKYNLEFERESQEINWEELVQKF